MRVTHKKNRSSVLANAGSGFLLGLMEVEIILLLQTHTCFVHS